MSEQSLISLHYQLSLEESQDGFALVTFGKKQFTRFITPVVSLAVIIWGLYLGLDGVGRYYVALGGFFLIMQVVMRYWFLPLIFKRQFLKYQFGNREQKIDFYQGRIEVSINNRPQVLDYSDVLTFAEGKLTYMIEFKNQTFILVPKRIFTHPMQQNQFERIFRKK